MVLTIDGEEEITVGKINYVGVDANVKHNLFYTSTNHQIDYDRNMVKEYCEFIKRIEEALPPLPKQLVASYQQDFGLSAYDAAQLCDEKDTSDFFNAVAKENTNYKAIVNWITGPIKQYLNDSNLSIGALKLPAKTLGALIQLIDEGKVNFSVAATRIFPVLLQGDKQPLQVAEELNLLQVSDTNELEEWVDEAISKMPDKVAEYKKGKKGLIGLFVGEVKKLSKGKADPKVVTELLQRKLG